MIRASGGWAEDASDPDIVTAMETLASTEGIFGETAAGVTVACAKALIAQGRIRPDEETVLCITGNGLKTTDALLGAFTLEAADRAANRGLREVHGPGHGRVRCVLSRARS